MPALKQSFFLNLRIGKHPKPHCIWIILILPVSYLFLRDFAIVDRGITDNIIIVYNCLFIFNIWSCGRSSIGVVKILFGGGNDLGQQGRVFIWFGKEYVEHTELTSVTIQIQGGAKSSGCLPRLPLKEVLHQVLLNLEVSERLPRLQEGSLQASLLLPF